MVPQKVFDNLVIFGKTGNEEFKRFFTPKGLHSTAQGRAAHPWDTRFFAVSTPKGLYNPFGVEGVFLTVVPGCAARPWAVECNPFGVKKHGKSLCQKPIADPLRPSYR